MIERKKKEKFPEKSYKSIHSRKVKNFNLSRIPLSTNAYNRTKSFRHAPQGDYILIPLPSSPCFLKQYYFIKHCDSPRESNQTVTYPKFLDPPPFPSLFSHLTAVSTGLSQIFDRIIRQTPSNHFQPFETRPRTRCNTTYSRPALSSRFSQHRKLHSLCPCRRPATKSRSTEQWREREKKVYLGRCRSWIEKLIGRKIWKRVRVERTFTYELFSKITFTRAAAQFDTSLFFRIILYFELFGR